MTTANVSTFRVLSSKGRVHISPTDANTEGWTIAACSRAVRGVPGDTDNAPVCKRCTEAMELKLPILVEEVLWLLESGDRPLGIAARLVKSPATISRALYRAGRNDLAQPFASLDRKARRAQEATQ